MGVALKVLPAEQLQELLLSIGNSYAVLKGIGPHRGVVSQIDALLADIKRAGEQSLPDAFYSRLDDFEAELRKLKADAEKCNCKQCSEAA